jgi:hypothetical protein
MKVREMSNTSEGPRSVSNKFGIIFLKPFKQLMKISHLACTALLCASTGCFGYWLHGQSVGAASLAEAKSVPQLDDLIVHDSFSLIENTKTDLEGLCRRIRLDVEGRLVRQDRLWVQSGASGPVPEAQLDSIIHDLENGMNEFQGTDEELSLAEDLLRTFKMADQTDRWLEVYLKALYEHPTHPIVDLFAEQAIPMGKAAGREEEVIAGLMHVSRIPLNFQGKDKVEAVLLKVRTGHQLARADVALAPTNQ